MQRYRPTALNSRPVRAPDFQGGELALLLGPFRGSAVHAPIFEFIFIVRKTARTLQRFPDGAFSQTLRKYFIFF